jgi:hypothetical protein
LKIGAIVTIASRPQAEAENSVRAPRQRMGNGVSPSQFLLGSPIAFLEVLGKSVLDRTMERLRQSGVEQLSVISEDRARGGIHSSPHFATSTGGFWPAWDCVVSQYLNEGIEALLLMRLGSYVELDLPDLLRLHRETSSPLTQVCTPRTALDVVLVDAAQLRNGAGSYRSRLSALIAQRQRYNFGGYTNLLTDPGDFRRLVQDAFLGRCAIRPAGREVQPGIWLGENAEVDASARIVGPAYIGAQSRVRASCTISGASTVEQLCEVDCGTTIDDSCVFPGTYLGMGLSVSHALVRESKLFHLHRHVELEISDPRLIGTTFASRPVIRTARSFFAPTRAWLGSLSTRPPQLASLRATRKFGRFG